MLPAGRSTDGDGGDAAGAEPVECARDEDVADERDHGLGDGGGFLECRPLAHRLRRRPGATADAEARCPRVDEPDGHRGVVGRQASRVDRPRHETADVDRQDGRGTAGDEFVVGERELAGARPRRVDDGNGLTREPLSRTRPHRGRRLRGTPGRRSRPSPARPRCRSDHGAPGEAASSNRYRCRSSAADRQEHRPIAHEGRHYAVPGPSCVRSPTLSQPRNEGAFWYPLA